MERGRSDHDCRLDVGRERTPPRMSTARSWTSWGRSPTGRGYLSPSDDSRGLRLSGRRDLGQEGGVRPIRGASPRAGKRGGRPAARHDDHGHSTAQLLRTTTDRAPGSRCDASWRRARPRPEHDHRSAVVGARRRNHDVAELLSATRALADDLATEASKEGADTDGLAPEDARGGR